MTVDISYSQRAAWSEGQPISDLMERALANPHLISLAAGFVDQNTLPVDATSAALDAVFSDADGVRKALQYGTTPGSPQLREMILEDHLAADGRSASEADLSIDQVVLTAGSNQLLHLVVESLIDPGEIVLCAAPTYLVFLGTLANIGGRAIGVATDEHGIIPEALEEELVRLDAEGELPRVKLIYLVSYSDNPAGVNLPAERRAQIVELAKRFSTAGKIHVVADAAYRELRYFGDDTPSVQAYDEEGETVITTGTFSKSFAPGLRVGWGILPRHLVEPVCNQKGNIDFGSPHLSQQVMAKVLELGFYRPHVELLRNAYRKKLETMLTAADELLADLPGVHWVKPLGGLYVWLQLPSEIDTGPDGELLDAASDEGVMYVPGQYCFPNEGEPVQRNTIRLSFGVQSCQRIAAGMEALARAIRRVMG